MTIYSMRLSAVAIAALLAVGLRDEVAWQSAVTSIGFGHYLLSMWYARGRLSGLGGDWATAVPTLAAVVAGSLVYLAGFPLILYFAAHHVCNETYIVAGASEGLRPSSRRLLRAASIALHGLLYFTLLRSEFGQVLLRRGVVESLAEIDRPPLLFFAPLALAYVAYAAVLVRVRRELDRPALLELSIVELAGLALVGVSLVTPIRFLDVVCYHFVFWWFFPASRLARCGAGPVVRYAGWMTVLVGATFLLSPAVLPDYPFRDSIYLRQFLLWSHIHITSSFFLSSANPQWIRRWFTPGPAVQAA